MPARLATPLTLALSLVTVVPACATDDADLGPRETPPGSLDDLKLDSLKMPSEMGEIGQDEPLSHAEIKKGSRYHLWTFSLTAPQPMFRLWTQSYADDLNTNTVVYLYEQDEDGRWGEPIAENDDGVELPFNGDEGDGVINHAPFSLIERALKPGNYAVIVTGAYRQSRGAYEIGYDCDGGARCE